MNDKQSMTKDEYNSPTQRLVRIETMLALLCHHLGLDPRSGRHLSNDLQHKAKNARPRQDY